MRSKIQIGFAILLLSACGQHYITDERQFCFEGVKYISRGDSSPYASVQKQQTFYQLDADHRLLLRLESLSKNDHIYVDGDNQVKVQLSLAEESITPESGEALKLCPLTKDWMMLATWYLAHPFSNAGRWEKEGGDYDLEGCMQRSNDALDAKGNPEPLVQFDATRWAKDYPQGRQQNLGFVLLADMPVKIRGDKSGTYSPRMLMKLEKFHYVDPLKP